MNQRLVAALQQIIANDDGFPESDKPLPETLSYEATKWLWDWITFGGSAKSKEPSAGVVKDLEKHFKSTRPLILYRGLYFTPEDTPFESGDNQRIRFDKYQSWSTSKKDAQSFMHEGGEEATVGVLLESKFQPNDILLNIKEVLGEHWDWSLEDEVITKPGTYSINVAVSNT